MAVSTLVVGIGGTGTLSVRAAKRFYCALEESKRVPAEFLAIDFDRSALVAEENGGDFAALNEDDFLYLNPAGIQDLLRNLDRGLDGKPAWASVLEWFPDRERVQIPISEVEANGANQLRALGRLGCFLNDGVLETTLRGKLGKLTTAVDTIRMSSAKRVVLVSSLAGGTGGGLLLDLAYMVRRLEGRPRVFVYLLLPDVFLDVDSGGRVLQNSYGFLKELAYLKDQQLRFRAPYLNIAPLDVPVGGEEPFARLFLFNGAGGAGSRPIREACQQMGQAVLGQLHRTIQEKTLALVANVVSGSRADEAQRRRTHCFSTCGSGFWPLPQKHRLSNEALLHHVVQVALHGDPGAPLSETVQGMFLALEQRLEQHFGDGGRSRPSQAPASPATSPETTALDDEDEARPKTPIEATQLTRSARRVARTWKRHIAATVQHDASQVVKDLAQVIASTHAATRLLAAGGRPEVTVQPGASQPSVAHGSAPAGAPPGAISGPATTPAPEPTEGAAARIEGLRQLLLADFDARTYEDKLKQLRALVPAFRAFDENLRGNIGVFFATFPPALDAHTLQSRRDFLRRLQALDREFWTDFPKPSSESIGALRDDWTKLVDEAQHERRRPGGLWAWLRLDDVGPALDDIFVDLRKCALLERALVEPFVRDHIAAMLEVRAYKAWRRRLDEVTEAVEQACAPLQEVFRELPGSEQASSTVSDLPETIRARIDRALRPHLAELMDQARVFADKSPSERQERILALIGKLRQRVSDLREAQFGIEDADQFRERVRELLIRCRQRVFERRTPNPQRKGFALVLVPRGVFGVGARQVDQHGCPVARPPGHAGTEMRDTLRDFLSAVVTQTLDARCQLEEYDGDRIWVYYEDLFNPPEHIRNLDEYYRAYRDSPLPELFHIDRRFLDDPVFREIHSGMAREITRCGNPECRENIGALPRTERICPGCGRMIRTRCGNEKCHADDVNTRTPPLGPDEDPPKHCSACRGFDHSRWWKCPRHGKVEVDIPIDKERCPRCVEQHQRDPLAYPSECISLRPDLIDSQVCPRCEDLVAADPEYKAFRVPRDLLRFYRDGVNGHDREPFDRVAQKYSLPDRVRCPRCRTLLIPVHHEHGARAAAVAGAHIGRVRAGATACPEDQPCA